MSALPASLLVPESYVERLEQRARWMEDPAAWVAERAGGYLWSTQRRILYSIRDNRKTAVKSCHGPGKSFTAAQAVAWWLDIHPPGEASVVTTAPTDRQVKYVLWKEIRRTHARAKLDGRTNQKEWLLQPPGEEERVVGFGMKPADYDPDAFQGIHEHWVLVIADEACGIPGSRDEKQSLWDSMDSLLTNDDCRMLAIGNPDYPGSEFARICRPGSGFHVISISAFDTPNFTGEAIPERLKHVLVGRTWVEEKRAKWSPNWTWTPDGTRCVPPEGVKVEDSHPLWLSKVLGVFPENTEAQGLIPITWVEAAMERELVPKSSDPNELGVDVGAGGDSSTIAHRHGPRVRILSEDHNPDTMQTCGNVIAARRSTRATRVKVDTIGIGKGVTDRGIEQGEPFEGVNVGEAAEDSERFANRKAELWWGVRERFEAGDVDLDPTDEATAAELISLRFFRTSRGQVLIESKEQAKKRGVPSPNRAEAIMLAFAPQRTPEPQYSAKLLF